MAEKRKSLVALRWGLLFSIAFAIFSLSLLPPTLFFVLILGLMDLHNVFYLLFLPFLLLSGFMLLISSLTMIPGFFVYLIRRGLKEGEYEISVTDGSVFRYTLYCALYRHALKLLNIFNILPLRYVLLRLAGLKMGRNCILLGNELIEDPFATEIGNNTLVGGYSIITAHLIEDKLIIKKVKIGDNCLIGGLSFIMPGVIVEDNVTVGAMCLVPKNKVLKKGGIYAGIPARRIGKRE